MNGKYNIWRQRSSLDTIGYYKGKHKTCAEYITKDRGRGHPNRHGHYVLEIWHCIIKWFNQNHFAPDRWTARVSFKAYYGRIVWFLFWNLYTKVIMLLLFVNISCVPLQRPYFLFIFLISIRITFFYKRNWCFG